MSALSQRLRRAREVKVEASPFVFTILRPTDVEWLHLQSMTEGPRRSALIASWVIGWGKQDGSAVTEVDLGIPNGDPHPLAFDSEDCTSFLFDNIAVFQPVALGIMAAYTEHAKANGDAAKN